MADELEPSTRSDVEPNAMRVSDADREKVAKTLHEAMAEGRIDMSELEERLDSVYKAKTVGELVPLTADLPGASPVAVSAPAPSTAARDRTGTTPGAQVSFAVMSGFERKGTWTVPPNHTAIAVMGGGEIDLSDAKFVADETTISCIAIMGGVEIRVPEDVNVQVTGFGFMGAFENSISDPERAGAGAPTVKVNGFAMMGGVEVKRPKRSKKNKQQELE